MNSDKDESQNKYLHEHFPENLWVSSFMDHAFRCQGLCKWVYLGWTSCHKHQVVSTLQLADCMNEDHRSSNCDFSCNLSPQLQLNTWPSEFSETFPCFLRGLQHELWQVMLNRISVICFHLLSFYVLTSTEVLKLELSLKILEGTREQNCGIQSTRRQFNSPTPTHRRIKSSRNVSELVFNPVQLIRS